MSTSRIRLQSQVLALNLVDIYDGSGWFILYCVDKFSRLTKGCVIRDKSDKFVVDGILKVWIFWYGVGPGLLSSHFFSDLPETQYRRTITLGQEHVLRLATQRQKVYSKNRLQLNVRFLGPHHSIQTVLEVQRLRLCQG